MFKKYKTFFHSFINSSFFVKKTNLSLNSYCLGFAWVLTDKFEHILNLGN